MPRVDLTLKVPLEQTARVRQVMGIFDVPAKKLATADYHFDVPLDDREWAVGLVVGPSGAGKSSVARHLFGGDLVDGYAWEPGKAVVDGFGDLPIDDIVGALNSVGFASPPGWIKPYSVLSNGEKFRVNLARAILDPRPLVAVDEFSSVVDRQVARIGAHAAAKAIRARPGKRFVAVTCHEDVLEWLQPDWVLEPHVGRFSWRAVQRRPPVQLEVVRAVPQAWSWFAPHHYLSADLHKGARCFVGLVDGAPAAFGAILKFPGPGRIWKLHRLVVLPDYQGLGLGAHTFPGALGSIVRALGDRMRVTTSHPALIRAWARAGDWRMTKAPGFESPKRSRSRVEVGSMALSIRQRRRVAGFEYVGAPLEDVLQAKRLWA
jgi:GNAT superfamily N-acetyltransferase